MAVWIGSQLSGHGYQTAFICADRRASGSAFGRIAARLEALIAMDSRGGENEDENILSPALNRIRGEGPNVRVGRIRWA